MTVAPGQHTAQGEVVVHAPLFVSRQGQRVVLTHEPPPARPQRTRATKLARLIALAHRLEQRLDAGETRDALALELRWTTARLSQVLDLTRLAPDLAERLLLQTTDSGDDPVAERSLRPVLRHLLWAHQREAFAALFPNVR